MLSRVANTLYWMARYVERADNLARLIDVNRHLLLDNETLGSDRIADFWRPIILCTGDEELFQSLYPETYGEDVIRFLTDDPRNVSSIVSCIAQFVRARARCAISFPMKCGRRSTPCIFSSDRTRPRIYC